MNVECNNLGDKEIARVFSLLALDLRAGKVALCCVALRRVRVPRVGRVLAACGLL